MANSPNTSPPQQTPDQNIQTPANLPPLPQPEKKEVTSVIDERKSPSFLKNLVIISLSALATTTVIVSVYYLFIK